MMFCEILLLLYYKHLDIKVWQIIVIITASQIMGMFTF